MTKEEYERLLKSDYWRGYSYSLIKERNFTCEDCGRQFLNERNKLQVHHLVYRDTNPWSYNPDEVIVLCEECHKRRHGIIEPEPTPSESAGYSSSYSFCSENNEERSDSFGNNTSAYFNGVADRNSRNPWPEEKKSKFKWEYIIYGLLALLALNLGYNNLQNLDSANKVKNQKETLHLNGDVLNESEPQIQDQNDISSHKNQLGKGVSVRRHTTVQPTEAVLSSSETESARPQTDIQSSPNLSTAPKTATSRKQNTKSDEGLSTLELIERRNHQDAVNRAKSMGLSTEGSTLDILERINHAEVVNRAKRAGVSTKGSTLDILERINHAEVVKRAERAGVSTNGSTMDILERINHAEVVKRAKRMGVSTEGSTMDILERINRKSLESY